MDRLQTILGRTDTDRRFPTLLSLQFQHIIRLNKVRKGKIPEGKMVEGTFLKAYSTQRR